jgi:hypothetical protein
MRGTIGTLTLAALLAGCGSQQPEPGDTPAANATAAADQPRRTKRERRASQYLRADADGDGVVTRAEIEREATDRFAALDGNGDGTVSRDEFAAKSGSGRRRDPDRPAAPFTREAYVARALARFDRRDRDDDGRLSGEELERVTRAARPRP